MSHWTIYHNPRCSKSLEALALLEAAGVKPKVIEYLKDPLSEKDLESLAAQLTPSALVRSKEEAFKEKPFALDSAETVARELCRRPELLERPIVVKGGKAVIGRPPENVKKLGLP